VITLTQSAQGAASLQADHHTIELTPPRTHSPASSRQPGDEHHFADPALPSYDPAAAALLTERVLAFLAGARP
jgi:dienelactone hydrolase